MAAVAPLVEQPAPEVDLDLQRLVLDVAGRRVRDLDTRIEGSIVDGELERTMEGASTLTLTVHDPRRALLQSGMFSRSIDVRLDRLYFRLVKVGKAGDDLTLTFEDREVARLRQHDKPRKATRGKLTRAQFALSLVREVKPPIRFVCPELRQRQPIAGQGDRRKLRKALPFQFRRGGSDGTREDSWTCLQRLAQEVNWRCFCSAGAVWFISESELRKAKPRLVLSEQTLGVSAIDFDIDNGKVRSQVSVTCRARRWAAPPGSVVQLSGLGPANGLWLVASVQRGLFDADATITLKRATQKLPEPAPEAAPTPTTGGRRSSRDAPGAASSPVRKVYAAALAMDAKHLPYVWGGGHGAAGVPSGGGYDCSGSTCAILAAGGLGFHRGGPVSTSGAIARGWGVPGRGEYLTVYANDVHVFVVFHTAKGDQHFGTGRWGKSWGGPGFNPTMHPTAGFSARHWPGT
jgi:hypothetical protein